MNSACSRSSAFSLVMSRKTTMIPSPSVPTGELTIDTKMRFSELVNRNNLSLCVGWFFDKDWTIGFSRSSTSFPSEVTSFKTLFQLSPSASPWSQPMICWADGFISSMLPSLEIARTPSSMALITTSDLLSTAESLFSKLDVLSSVFWRRIHRTRLKIKGKNPKNR